MKIPKSLYQILPAVGSQSRGELRQPAGLREASPQEKNDFFKICRHICPKYQITPEMKPLLNDIVRWCLCLDGKYDPEKGLWLWGDIGTGKSTMLQIVNDYCRMVRKPVCYRDKAHPRELMKDPWEYGFRITNASAVAGAFAKEGYPGIEGYIINCRQAFDEVGRECIPTGYFGNMENVFQYIFQRRYDLRYGDFTHVTSNLAPEQIGEVYGDHIYDRCIEMFNFVQMTGESWR